MKSNTSDFTTTPRGARRPSTYTPEIAQRICEQIATSFCSVRTICEAPDMPGRATVYRWMKEYPEFAEMYWVAREEQLEFLAEDMLRIAEDDSKDWRVDEKGKEVPDRQAIARSKIRVQARQWLLAHLIPKEFKLSSEMRMNNEPIVRRRHISAEELEERMRLAMA